jgi:hypothetical protein
VLSIPDNIERYSTAASIAPAAVSATNTTVAATSAERADIPQLHGRRRRIGISPPFTPEIRHVYRTMCAVPDMREIHQWFLDRRPPLVLTRRVRSRALIERSAPVVSGIGAVIALTMMLAELTGGDADFGNVTRLAVLTLLLIAAPVALYLLHQTGTTLGRAGRRSAALLVMALFVTGFPSRTADSPGLPPPRSSASRLSRCSPSHSATRWFRSAPSAL